MDTLENVRAELGRIAEWVDRMEDQNRRLTRACRAAYQLTTKWPRPTDDEGYRFSNEVTFLCLKAMNRDELEKTQ